MTHPWQKHRPISAWIPAGISAEKKMVELPRKVTIDQSGCSMCEMCWLLCPEGAIKRDGKIEVVSEQCRCCGICIEVCPKHVMSFFDEALT